MADDVWTSLFEDIQLVLYPDWDENETLISPTDGDSLQLRDTLTGQRILFREDDKGLDIRVTVPDEPVTAARLRAVIQSQRTTLFSQVRDRESGRWVPRDQPLWKSVEIHIGRDHDVEHEGSVSRSMRGSGERDGATMPTTNDTRSPLQSSRCCATD
ncbi:hypothetical protein FEZ60_02285 [Rhodococcus sp. MS16]|uniref:hypothetical protein n=1 Tax=Rhodococcus sp. MS16 TaxID=2579941 RepID=UPI001562AAF4|nr:hypothetical protein [Rhodococcus sp. MS16]NRI64378.1 hypothetical protein [Rhodococcus sp. MS16]